MSLTGDPRTDALVEPADAMVCAVRALDTEAVGDILAEVDVHGLAVVLAAMVCDDLPASGRLGWLADPGEYRRLRAAGVGHFAALTCLRMSPRDGT